MEYDISKFEEVEGRVSKDKIKLIEEYKKKNRSNIKFKGFTKERALSREYNVRAITGGKNKLRAIISVPISLLQTYFD